MHCAGVVEQLASAKCDAAIPSSVPRRIPTDERVGDFGDFTDNWFPDGATFYTTMSARIGDAYAYGPHFQVIGRIDQDTRCDRIRCRFEVEQDAALWSAWDKMGYVLHPTLLDGVLQIFTMLGMEMADITGVPQQVAH